MKTVLLSNAILNFFFSAWSLFSSYKRSLLNKAPFYSRGPLTHSAMLLLIFSYAGTYISFTFLFVSCLTYLCVDLKGRATSGPVAMLTIFLSKSFKPTLDLWLDCRELEVPIPELTTDTTCEVLHFVKIPYKGNTVCL